MPPLDALGRSEEYLGVIETPSTLYLAIVHYDEAYSDPWRVRTNYGVNVIRYTHLPQIDND